MAHPTKPVKIASQPHVTLVTPLGPRCDQMKPISQKTPLCGAYTHWKRISRCRSLERMNSIHPSSTPLPANAHAWASARGPQLIDVDTHHHDHHQGQDQQPTVASTPAASAAPRRPIHELLQRHRDLHSTGDLQRDHSFSWGYFVVSLISYALLLSDIMRAGLGLRAVPATKPIEPDSYNYFGPFAYAMNHLTTRNMTSTTAYWGYKYDTTSIAMRSIAQFLELPAWSPCLHYKEHCDESLGLPLRSVFSMVDELVDAVGSYRATDPTRRLRSQLTLRTTFTFRDRLHHYALPWFFATPVRRTNQAIHYTYNATGWNFPLCGQNPTSLSSRRPYSCDENWTHYGRLDCPTTGLPDCRPNSRIWDNIPKRLAFLADVYRNHTIDFVVLDSMEDFTRSRLSFQGNKYFEVVVFTRIRKCDDATKQTCETVAVDDYRYESVAFTMNPVMWFPTVATLRLIGQAYMWLRVLMLVRGCYAACSREARFRQLSLVGKTLATIRTVFLIPSQVVIYGSSFPIFLYMIAHLIDSHAIYEIISAHFTSWLGIFHFNFEDFVRQCAVSMRTVWILGFLCHTALSMSTSRSWSPIHGIPGMSELTLSILASITVFAQFRSVTFRNCEILQADEVLPSKVHRHLHSASYDSTRTTVDLVFFSSTIDTKILACGFIALLLVTLVVGILHRTFPKWFASRMTLASRTVVPYSAGFLWSRNSLVVNWFGTLVSTEASPHDRRIRTASTLRTRLTSSRLAEAVTTRVRRWSRQLMDKVDKGLIMRHIESTTALQMDMHVVNQRNHEVNSMVYLVNLAVITDPITFLRLRVFRGRLVGLYKSKVTHQWLLLPYGLASSNADIPIDWNELQLEAVINSKDLDWHDLLQCG